MYFFGQTPLTPAQEQMQHQQLMAAQRQQHQQTLVAERTKMQAAQQDAIIRQQQATSAGVASQNENLRSMMQDQNSLLMQMMAPSGRASRPTNWAAITIGLVATISVLGMIGGFFYMIMNAPKQP